MQHTACFLFATTLAGALAAQSNVVVGLDGRLIAVDSLTYYGRRGPAYPGGQIGMAMLNEMCNPGTVNIPWYSAMQPDHPKFGFLITRVSGGRMVQINDWSYVKHAFTSVNASGPCGTCIVPPVGGAEMGVHCSDTYAAGNNSDRTWLGPPSEIDPWLGTWNPIGSYFDRGDPPVSGPAATDGVRSLTSQQIAAFDQVKNRVTVNEADLVTAGASYYYGIQLIHQGEAVANRGDNLASRGFTPVYTASTNSWSFNNNAVAQTYGSILQHWSGATLDSGGNGNDDGRFFVAVNVTGPVGGMYHYEYAVHNVDNSRGGAALHIPLDPAATISGIGFRDIDTDPLDDWTSARNANELLFSAPANNPQNWNTIYNFWFDCSAAPSFGQVNIDEARAGTGSLSVAVNSRVPSGIPTASVTNFGTGCGSCASSFYEEFTSPSSFDLSNHSLTMTLTNGTYAITNGTGTYQAPTGGTNLGLGDDAEIGVNLPFSFPFPGGSTTLLDVCSNGFISSNTGNGVSYTPSASGFLANPVPCWAAAWHDFNPSAGGQVLSNVSAAMVRITWLAVPDYGTSSTSTMQYQFLPNGTVNIIWQTMSTQGSEYLVGFTHGGGAIDPGPIDIDTRLAAGFSLCATDSHGLAFAADNRPVLGTTIGLVTSSIPPNSPFGATVIALDAANPPVDLTSVGMQGCFSYTQNGVTNMFFSPGATNTYSLTIPNATVLIGVNGYTQAFTYSPPLTTLGAISSNGVQLTLGL